MDSLLSKKILVIGDCYMNLKMQVNMLDKEKNTIYGNKYGYHASGKSTLTAVTIGKLGGKCTFATHIGEDTNGEKLALYFDKCGLNNELITKHKDLQSGMSVTIYDDIGINNSYISRGACSKIDKAFIEDSFSSFPDALIIPQDSLLEKEVVEHEIVFNNDFDESSQTRVINETRFENLSLFACTTAIDKDIDLFLEYNENTAKLPLPIISNIKAVILDESDLKKITGIDLVNVAAMQKAISIFSTKVKAKYYIVNTKGSSFVSNIEDYEYAEAPSILKDNIESKSFSNSIFIGAFTHEFLKTKNPVRSARLAQIVTLLSRSEFDIVDYVPTAKEIEAFINDNNIDLNRNNY